jgi:pyruvate/2-oxoglutarate dehydrogenase complex dihydrolipoamide acyltransferase (E2) component
VDAGRDGDGEGDGEDDVELDAELDAPGDAGAPAWTAEPQAEARTATAASPDRATPRARRSLDIRSPPVGSLTRRRGRWLHAHVRHGWSLQDAVLG